MLRPERVDFGLVPLGWPAQEAIVVVNVGDEEEVHVVGVRIEGGGREAFSVEAGELPARVDGEGWEAVLRVEAAAVGRQEAEVVIETDSLVQPELRLPVFADAVGPTQCRLALDRDEIFFGSVLAPKDWWGTETYRLVRSVRVKNEGSSPCLLWDVRIEGDAADHYELLASLPPAFQLEGGEELELPVRIHVGEAAFEEPLLAELTVRWGGVEEQPLRIPVRGMKYPSYPFWRNEPLGLPFDPTPVGAAIIWRSPRRLIGGRMEVHLSPDTPPDFVFPNLYYYFSTSGSEYIELAFAPTREGTISGQLQFVVDRDIYPYLWDIEAVGLPACEGDCDWPSAFCGEDVELQAGEVYEYSDPTWPHECNWRLFDSVRTPASFYGGAHFEHSWMSRLPAESYPGSSFPKDKHLLLPVAQKACHGWFRAHAVGTYELGNLRVRPDGRGAYCSRTIRATPPPGLWIELQAPGIHWKDFGILYGTAPPWESESWRVAGFGCLSSDFPYEEPCPIGGADAEGTARLPELRTSMTIHVDNPQRSGLPYYFGMEYSSLPAPPEEPIQIQVRVYCDGELAGTASLVLGLDVFTVLGEVRFFEGGGCTFTPDGQTTW